MSSHTNALSKRQKFDLNINFEKHEKHTHTEKSKANIYFV